MRSSRALNCSPCWRSAIQSPSASRNSPGLTLAAEPTTVISSRCPRTLTRSTQKPLYGLWKVRRSMAPLRRSTEGGSDLGLAQAYLEWSLSDRLMANTTLESDMSFDQDALERARAAWRFRGQQRPDFAQTPAEGQESVWDYPRPPVYVPETRLIEVYAGDALLARTKRSLRALETGSPPTFYLPPEALDQARLIPSRCRTVCEWKGEAEYFDVQNPAGVIRDAVWRYPHAVDAAASLAGWYACYPALLRCFVDGEPVKTHTILPSAFPLH